MRVNIEGARVRNNLVTGNRTNHTVLRSATGAAITLGADTPDFIEVQVGTTGGAEVRLPAPTSALRGRKLTILNNSTGANRTATIKTSTGGALPVASTVVRYRMKHYVCNGSLWFSDSSN